MKPKFRKSEGVEMGHVLIKDCKKSIRVVYGFSLIPLGNILKGVNYFLGKFISI
jgi:hypothetical protein